MLELTITDMLLIALLNSEASSGCWEKYVHQSMPCRWLKAGLPVRRLCPSAPKEFCRIGSPTYRARSRIEPGTSLRRVAASGVRAKECGSTSVKTPTLASARRPRYSAPGWAPVRSAMSSTWRTSSPMASATPRSATAMISWLTREL